MVITVYYPQYTRTCICSLYAYCNGNTVYENCDNGEHCHINKIMFNLYTHISKALQLHVITT